MLQAFMIVLREGIEAFLIVAITFAYLQKTSQHHLLRSVWWGIAASLLVSGLLGYFLWVNQGEGQPLWEGIFASVTVVLVASFIVHMWQVGPELKKNMEAELTKAALKPSRRESFIGVLVFTIFMISREGMEMTLLLFQVREPQIVSGVLLGVLAAAVISILWQRFGYLINLKHFFQITAVYLLLFTVQIAVQAFHEFTEAGIFPNSEFLHAASEPYSTEGLYGKWFANMTFVGCTVWLVFSLLSEKVKKWHRKTSFLLKGSGHH